MNKQDITKLVNDFLFEMHKKACEIREEVEEVIFLAQSEAIALREERENIASEINQLFKNLFQKENKL